MRIEEWSRYMQNDHEIESYLYSPPPPLLVITLKLFYVTTKLSRYEVGNMQEFGKYFRFLLNGINPKLVSKVIKKKNIIF